MGIFQTVANLFSSKKTADVRGRFASAMTTELNRKQWAYTDNKSARAAYDPSVRQKLRARSRFLDENNSVYNGMIQTAAAHIVGTGPKLQVTTPDQAYNAKVEALFEQWSTAIELTDKLSVAVQTMWRDGEVFALRADDFSMPHSLDVRLYEADQVASPYTGLDITIEDGLRVGPSGRVVEYHFLRQHPGANYWLGSVDGSWFPANDVVHLMIESRPGQVRAVPKCAPAIDDWALLDRFRLATLHAAESAAMFAVLLKTTNPSYEPAQLVEGAYASVDLQRNMITSLPEGWDVSQVRPEHPASTYDMFAREMLVQICRCSCMPYSLAAGTSKDSNFSSAKMDIVNTWAPEVRRQQRLLEAKMLAKVFGWFCQSALIEQTPHRWDWDRLPVADELDAANAATARLASGLSTLPLEYAKAGIDFETAMQQGAAAFGVPTEEYRRAVFNKLFDIQPAAQPQQTQQPELPVNDRQALLDNALAGGAA
jgi:capsid protein